MAIVYTLGYQTKNVRVYANHIKTMSEFIYEWFNNAINEAIKQKTA